MVGRCYFYMNLRVAQVNNPINQTQVNGTWENKLYQSRYSFLHLYARPVCIKAYQFLFLHKKQFF